MMDRFQVQSCAFSKRNVRSYLIYLIAMIKCISIENEFTKSQIEQFYVSIDSDIFFIILERASNFNQYVYLKERFSFLRQEKGFSGKKEIFFSSILMCLP